MNPPDLFRFVVLAIGGFAFGLGLWTLRVYLTAQRSFLSKTKTQPSLRLYEAGALAKHVVAVALATEILVGVSLIEVASHVGDASFSWWRSPPELIAYFALIYGLGKMLRFQLKRVNVRRALDGKVARAPRERRLSRDPLELLEEEEEEEP